MAFFDKWWDRVPKKAIVFVVGVILQIIPDRFIDQTTKNEITKVTAGYLLGQGIADFGKERAKIEGKAMITAQAPTAIELPIEMPLSPPRPL